MNKYRVFNIEWDTEQEDGSRPTPEECGLPDAVMVPDDVEDIADYLSDEYDFCVFGYEVEKCI